MASIEKQSTKKLSWADVLKATDAKAKELENIKEKELKNKELKTKELKTKELKETSKIKQEEIQEKTRILKPIPMYLALVGASIDAGDLITDGMFLYFVDGLFSEIHKHRKRHELIRAGPYVVPFDGDLNYVYVRAVIQAKNHQYYFLKQITSRGEFCNFSEQGVLSINNVKAVLVKKVLVDTIDPYHPLILIE